MDPDDHRHGTYHGYTRHKCRCDECREANRVYARRLRRRNGPAPSAAPIRRAQSKAVTWVREHYPDVWQSCLNDAYSDLDISRRLPGRPLSTPPTN